MSITAYTLMFINIPKDAPFGETDVEKHFSIIGKSISNVLTTGKKSFWYFIMERAEMLRNGF